MRPSRAVLVLGVFLVLADVADAQTPPCRVSSDPQFGFSAENAVPVGGGAFNGPPRRQRYLAALRGPEGQAVTVAPGVGSAPNSTGAIVDRYSVSYDGKTMALYINVYAFGTPQVPQGFSCGASLSAALGPPPPEPAAVVSTIAAHAAAEGISRPIASVPFTDFNGTVRAVIVDFFNLASARARTGPLPPNLPPAVMAIAYPLTCGDALVSASAIDVLNPAGQVAPRPPQLNPVSSGLADAPAGSVSALFGQPSPLTQGTLRIRYPKSDACADLPQEIVVSFRPEVAQIVTSDPLPLPAGVSDPDPSVFLNVLLDVDGSFKQPTYITGPESLREAAIKAVASWKAIPARLNGEAVVTVTTVRVAFK